MFINKKAKHFLQETPYKYKVIKRNVKHDIVKNDEIDDNRIETYSESDGTETTSKTRKKKKENNDDNKSKDDMSSVLNENKLNDAQNLINDLVGNDVNVVRVKNDKGLIERAEAKKVIIVEDNRQIICD